MQNNPLSHYFRQTKISVPLPTRGKFYKPGLLELNNNDELDIKAMTAENELSLKNPDALLNGQGMVDVMKSCAPGIVGNPSDLSVPDVSVIMLAIRNATYGDIIDFKATCPECQTENKFERSIRSSFDLIEFLDDEYVIELENGLKIYVCPHTFRTSTKSHIAQFEQAKIMQLIDREEMADDEKLRTFGNSFTKMVQMNFDLISDSVLKIVTPDKQEVTDRKFILEFIRELEGSQVDSIRNLIQKINDIGVPTSHNCECTKCGHTWIEEGVQFDPSHFFE
jgi:hypothetical protein